MQAPRYHARIARNPLPRIVTTVTENRVRYFEISVIANIAVERLRYAAREKGIYLYAYAVMPDHVHVVCKMTDHHTVSDFMHCFKRLVAKDVKRWHKSIHDKTMSTSSFWQSSFHQLLIFGKYRLYDRIRYVANNAVKHGIVTHRNDYPWTYVAPEFTYVAHLQRRG